MHPPISSSDLVSLLEEADRAAARLWRRLRLPATDLDDLRQDLLVDLLRRLPAFNASRGTIRLFAGLVLRNQASRIAGRIARERRKCGGRLLSLDEPDQSGRTLRDRLAEADGLAAWQDRHRALEAVVACRLDIGRALGALDERDRHLCAAACICPMYALVARSFGSRARLYRRLRDLRCALAAHGARAA